MQRVNDPEKGIPGILEAIHMAVLTHPQLAPLAMHLRPAGEVFTMSLRAALTRLCTALDRPLVMLFDEVDCLAEGTLVTFLRQLRDGYVNRAAGTPFPHSLALVGMRNIRDDPPSQSFGSGNSARGCPDDSTPGSTSPFHIVAESLKLASFAEAEDG